MSDTEGPGFVIRDRRGRSDDGGTTQDQGTASRSQQDEPSQAELPPAGEPGPPISFSSFVFSLGTSALMLMGEHPDPKQAGPPLNLPQAKEIIDILSMLDEKTKGNQTSDEQAVLTDMLYALRMKYVDLSSGPQRPQSS